MSVPIFMKFTNKSNLANISYNQPSIQSQLEYQPAPAMTQPAPAMTQPAPAMIQPAPAIRQASTPQIGNIFRNMFSFNTSKNGCGSCGG